MSISTYEALRVAVASRMKRADSVADVPDYIEGAEDIFRRELRFRQVQLDRQRQQRSERLRRLAHQRRDQV
jgi:hypothetical protein